jgi:mercuric ion transport protein
MGLMTRIADKTGALGSVVSAMGCAACFPALPVSARPSD